LARSLTSLTIEELGFGSSEVIPVNDHPLVVGRFLAWRCRVVKPPLRTKTLGTKVRDQEYAQLEAAASERGLTLSEWCRETLPGKVNGQEEKSADTGATSQALMAEPEDDPAQRALQAGERGKADGGRDATADRPGGLGQAEEGTGTAGAGGKVGRAAGRKILKIV
jgi:hypothetical protein